jgi:hypothetical protein
MSPSPPEASELGPADEGSSRERDERPVLPDRADDDRDEAWGDRAEDGDAADRRLWEDRPPHHDGRSSW